MAAPIKMDELLVSWLGSDDVYENVLNLIEKYDEEAKIGGDQGQENPLNKYASTNAFPSTSEMPPTNGKQPIPPFYPLRTSNGTAIHRRRKLPKQFETWDPLPDSETNGSPLNTEAETLREENKTPGDETVQNSSADVNDMACVRDQLSKMLQELQVLPREVANSDVLNSYGSVTISLEVFVRVTKEICHFPSFFNGPLFQRIILLWNIDHPRDPDITAVSLSTLEWYWKKEMEPFDPPERFFRLVKQPGEDCILRDDFLPYIKALLNDHPGLEFLSNHAEFQEKYAVTVITRIFYSVNKCHSGRITSRQVRRSDLLESFLLVDEEEDINRVTRYFSYEHFYVLYCRFWELDHDRDYRITREDLLKYGDHSLSHMIVDRIFDSAPRPFEQDNVDREHLSYEEFIYFMLSEEDKSNEVSVRYWFNCVDVDGDGKLNNMEMRSFYAVQLHRMQCMGHEIVPFEDMLCQMMDMIKPRKFSLSSS